MDWQMVKTTISKTTGKKSVTGAQFLCPGHQACKKHQVDLVGERFTCFKDIRSGGRDMKSSQQYPRAFGTEVARLHLEYMQSADPWYSIC